MAYENPAYAKALANSPECYRWFDHAEHRDLHEKAERAIMAYVDAYGYPPEFIWVHPRNRVDYPQDSILGVRIFETTATMYNNFVLGVDRQAGQRAGGAA